MLETERQHPEWTDFIDSSAYSHEVFRRIFRTALENGIISRNIFSDRDQRIKASAKKDLLNDAIAKAHAFLTAMRDKDLSLSRDGNYADKSLVEAFVKKFELSPDNKRLAESPPPKKDDTSKDSTEEENQKTEDTNTSEETQDQDTPEKSQGKGISRSTTISGLLVKLNSKKLISLYNSLCIVSLKSHPQLMYVGAWSFFETLTYIAGRAEKTSFPSFLNSKMNCKAPCLCTTFC